MKNITNIYHTQYNAVIYFIFNQTGEPVIHNEKCLKAKKPAKKRARKPAKKIDFSRLFKRLLDFVSLLVAISRVA
jgi:hypothetical protein